MAEIPQATRPRFSPQQYEGLLEVSRAIVRYRDLATLFQELAQRLHPVVEFDYIALILHDPRENTTRLHLLEAPFPRPPDAPLPVNESPGGWVWEHQQALVIPSVAQETRFPKITWWREAGIQSVCIVPLTTATRRLGAMTFGSRRLEAHSTEDVAFLQEVANHVAIAVENALNYERAQSSQQQLTRERDRQRLLLEVNNAVVSHLNLRELLTAISACLRQVVPHDFSGLALYDSGQHQLRAHVLNFPRHQDFFEADFPIPEGTPPMLAFTSRQTVLRNHLDPTKLPDALRKHLGTEGIRSGCSVPLISHDRVQGTLDLISSRETAFTEQDAELLGQIGSQIAIAVENALAYQEITELKNKLAEEKLYLEEEIRTELNFEEIIGESAALKRVLKQVETVAPTDSAVLILGETGTGKELIARAIHNLSRRREHTVVKVNCAAIPTGLLESELFGHERGAFTGAIAQKVGRFELAHQGTLFLDEVGDIPLELQSKLLRVLQEQEFERLGSTRTIRVDVRLVAATNQDLGQMVADKQFRNDLYYRLKVFPILLPPLRERPEDIPLLVRHFAQKYGKRMKKRIHTIPAEALAAMTQYPWPGNVRELENFVERAVILSQGQTLQIPIDELKIPAGIGSTKVVPLKDAEREHILRALEETHWVIGGPSGAATLLGMKRTTLQAKIRRLGLSPPS